MKAEDFAGWLSAISGMSGGQRIGGDRGAWRRRARSGLEGEVLRRSAGQRRPRKGTRWERTSSPSASRLRAVLIARDARSSVGAARTDFCCRVWGDHFNSSRALSRR